MARPADPEGNEFCLLKARLTHSDGYGSALSEPAAHGDAARFCA